MRPRKDGLNENPLLSHVHRTKKRFIFFKLMFFYNLAKCLDYCMFERSIVIGFYSIVPSESLPFWLFCIIFDFCSWDGRSGRKVAVTTFC
jgi:hypothetical protein